MERVEQLLSLNKSIFARLSIVSAAIIVAGCASSSAELPTDYSSVNANQRITVEDFDPETAQLSCEEAAQELNLLGGDQLEQEKKIAGERVANQTLGYIGGIFFLPLVYVSDSAVEARKKTANIQAAKDKLYKLQAFKKC